MHAQDFVTLIVVLGGAIWLLQSILKIHQRNAESPLQRRLAHHMEAYANSDHSDAELVVLKSNLDRELEDGRVPRDERPDRLIGAAMLAGRSVKGDQARALIAAAKKLGIMK